MLNLEVQVPGEPVIEQRLVHIACCMELGGKKKTKNHKEIHDLTFIFSGSLTIEPQQSLPALV